MDYGIYIIAAIVVLFYLRMYLVRRGKSRREKLAVLERMKEGKHAKPLPARNPNTMAFGVKSWWLVVPGIILMLVGLAIHYEGFLSMVESFWWIPTAIGGLLFVFGFE
jgi:hypothetical protein